MAILTLTEAIKEFSYDTPAAMAAFHSNMLRLTIAKYTLEHQVQKITIFNTQLIFDGSFKSATDWIKGILSRMYPETAHFFFFEQTGFNVMEIKHKM